MKTLGAMPTLGSPSRANKTKKGISGSRKNPAPDFTPYNLSSGANNVSCVKAYRFTLADDDANMLFLIHYMLSNVFPHSSIASFSSAEDALRHIMDTGTDILITDHAMGRMNGAQLIRQLRELKYDIPIIM